MMRHGTILVAAMLVLAGAELASGQFSQQNRVLNYGGGRYTYGYSAQSTILNMPTVSPYLALTDFGGGGNSSRNYFTQVRPLLEAREVQQRQQRSISSLQQTVTSMRSAPQRNQSGIRATGHPTRFGTYLHYFPGLSRR